MEFYEKAKQEQVKGVSNQMYTENGAVVYSSSGSWLADFEFSLASLRQDDEKEIQKQFHRAFLEDGKLATKMLFQIGDVRESKGERHIFKAGLNYLGQKHPEILLQVMELIPEYTRWDHLIDLINNPNKTISRKATDLVVCQIKSDIENQKQGKPFSLCAKWLPSIQSKKPEDRKIAFKLESASGLSHKAYRKTLAGLREDLNIIEKYLSENRMDELKEKLSNLSSQQNLKYAKVLENKMGDEWQEHMEKVASGEEKMNAGVLTPADVVAKYTQLRGRHTDLLPYDLALENMWNNLKDALQEGGNNTIVIRDGSASMTDKINNSLTNLDVATALTIYCAERMNGDLNNKFITFSNHPEVIDMSHCNNLHDKLNLCYSYDDHSNTDLKATFDLLLDTLKNNNISQEEAPTNLLILSDMEFDRTIGSQVPLFTEIRNEWREAGYELPTLVFWQLNTNRLIMPEMAHTNVITIGGYSTDNLDLVLSGELANFSPREQIEKILSSERYDKVDKAYDKGMLVEQHIKQGMSNEVVREAIEQASEMNNIRSTEVYKNTIEYDER